MGSITVGGDGGVPRGAASLFGAGGANLEAPAVRTVDAVKAKPSAPLGTPAALFVEVELEPAIPKKGAGPQPSFRLYLRASSNMKQVREAVGRRLGVEATLVNLVAGVSHGECTRFQAYEDNEPLGERRRLKVLGVDLPTPETGDATERLRCPGVSARLPTARDCVKGPSTGADDPADGRSPCKGGSLGSVCFPRASEPAVVRSRSVHVEPVPATDSSPRLAPRPVLPLRRRNTIDAAETPMVPTTPARGLAPSDTSPKLGGASPKLGGGQHRESLSGGAGVQTLGYICPNCGQTGLPDLQAAANHCNADAGSRTETEGQTPVTLEGCSWQSTAAPASPVPKGARARSPQSSVRFTHGGATESPTSAARLRQDSSYGPLPNRERGSSVKLRRVLVDGTYRFVQEGSFPTKSVDSPETAPAATGPADTAGCGKSGDPPETASSTTASSGENSGNDVSPHSAARTVKPSASAARSTAPPSRASAPALSTSHSTSPTEAPAPAPGTPATPVGASASAVIPASASTPAPTAASASAAMPASASTPATSSTAAAGPSAAAAPVPVAESLDGEPGEPVAYDDEGRLIISRQCDDDGSARTIVLNEDGSRKVFGANTVSSLLSSKESDAKRWVLGLTDRQIRALVHEFGHRLVHTSKQYTQHRKELEMRAKQADYAYFGLSEGATEKDLSVAYRKMAKRMHPDKNGGTDEAKRRFQAMKEKYEHLKEGYKPERKEEATEEPEAEPERGREDSAEAGDEEGSGTERQSEEGDEQPGAGREESSGEAASPDAEGDGEQEDGTSKKGDKNPQRQEAYDEDEDEVRRRESRRSRTSSEEDKRIEYDPHDRLSLDQTVWKMLGQMRRLQQSLDGIVGEMRRTRRF